MRCYFISFFVATILFSLSSPCYSDNINVANFIGPSGLQVNTFTGGLYYKKQLLYIPCGDITIDITLHYNSANTNIDKGCGRGWICLYLTYYKFDGSDVIVAMEDGREIRFTYNGSGYTPEVGVHSRLTRPQPNVFLLTKKDGTKYFYEDSTTKMITRINTPNNNNLTITDVNPQVKVINDPGGRNVILSFDKSGHLDLITDFNFLPPRDIDVDVDSLGNLNRIRGVENETVNYAYDGVHNMNFLRNESNDIVQIGWCSNLMNVCSLNDSLKSKTITYDTAMRKTTVTESVSGNAYSIHTTTYTYSLAGNLTEIEGDCCGYRVLRNYDASKNLRSEINNIGGNTLFDDYDNKGNCQTITKPDGSVWKKTFDTLYSNETSNTNPLGDKTTFKYDIQGNLLEVTKPLGITEHYTRNSFGQEISYTNGNGKTTIYNRNSFGYITSIDHPGGGTSLRAETESNVWDNVGNLISHTDENGNTTSYEYDKLNRKIKMTDALGNVTNYSYDAKSNLISVTDALGHVTSHTYDMLDRNLSTTTPAGTTRRTFDEAGNMLTSTDGNGNITRYSYNTLNQLITQTNALGHSKSFTYDGNGNILTETDYSGNITTNFYDAVDRLIKTIDPLGNTTIYTYDANGNRTSMKDARGFVTTFAYDALNRMIKEQRPIGNTRFEYDANGNQTKVTDPNNRSTTYIFDNRDRNIAIKDAMGNSSFNEYDPVGNLIAFTDRNNNTTKYTYDALNRRISQTNAAGDVSTTSYNAVGKISTQTLPTGNVISYNYDAADREVFAFDNIGPIVSKSYDANSNVITMTDANGNTTVNTYNALDKIVTAADPLGNSRRYTYNNNSSVIAEQDRNGNLTTYTYDALERLISFTSPIGISNSKTYDPVGNISSMTDDKGNRTNYTYDANRRLVSEIYANGSTKKYTYDPAGNLISRKDNNGIFTLYIYDALNRLTLRNYPGGNDDNFAYDNEANMITANNSNANILFTYDALNRPLSENQNGKITIYTNSLTNKKRTITYPGGRIITEDYDVRFRLSTIKEVGSTIALYKYDVGDRITSRTYSNGVVVSFTYNSNNWITSLKHSKNTTTIARFNYNFDNEGNRSYAEKIHRPSNSEKYSYDADYRLRNYKEGTLISNDIPSPLTQTQYNYDGAGNRTTVTKDASMTNYVSNNLNQYINITSGTIVNPLYDLNGNTLNDGIHAYTYDFENRLISVDGGTTATYKYDAIGRRIQKVITSGLVTSNYFYAGHRIVEERNASNAVTATNVFGNSIDEILNMRRNNIDYFYHENSLGSIVALSDNTGSPIERYEYDAFGKPAVYTGTYGTTAYFTDNFDGTNDSTSLYSRGYKIYYRGTSGQRNASSALWHTGDASIFPAFNGPSAGYVRGSFECIVSAGNIDNWLVLPRKNVGTGDSLFFYSRARGNGGHADSIRVMYSAAGDSVPEGSWVELGRFKVNIGGWQRKGFRAPSSGSNARFAIRYNVVNGGPNGTNSDYFGIDALTIEGSASTSSIGNTYMFTGREYDSERENYHYRSRSYKQDWGRFGQRDRIGYRGGINLYEFVQNNSTNLIDPFGYIPARDACKNRPGNWIIRHFKKDDPPTVIFDGDVWMSKRKEFYFSNPKAWNVYRVHLTTQMNYAWEVAEKLGTASSPDCGLPAQLNEVLYKEESSSHQWGVQIEIAKKLKDLLKFTGFYSYTSTTTTGVSSSIVGTFPSDGKGEPGKEFLLVPLLYKATLKSYIHRAPGEWTPSKTRTTYGYPFNAVPDGELEPADPSNPRGVHVYKLPLNFGTEWEEGEPVFIDKSFAVCERNCPKQP